MTKEEKEIKIKEIHALLMAGKLISEENKSPAFALFIQDFVMGTLNMTMAEIGSYFFLLFHQWDKFGLKDDPEELCEKGKCDLETLNKIKKKFKVCVDGKLRNSRLEKERAKQYVYRDTKILAGSIGSQIRWGKNDETKASKQSENDPDTFFYIGMQQYKYPVSKFVKDEFSKTISELIPSDNTALLEKVLKKMDSENVGARFNNLEHVRNSFKKIAKEMIVGTTKPAYKNQPEVKPTSLNFKLKSNK